MAAFNYPTGTEPRDDCGRGRPVNWIPFTPSSFGESSLDSLSFQRREGIEGELGDDSIESEWSQTRSPGEEEGQGRARERTSVRVVDAAAPPLRQMPLVPPSRPIREQIHKFK